MPSDEFEKCVKMISLLARRTVGETKMSDALKTSTYAPLRSIAGKIDGIGAGSDGKTTDTKIHCW